MHRTLSPKIISEVNNHIAETNRARVIITPKKVWQEKVDKNFGVVLQGILNKFEEYGYIVSSKEMKPSFTSCYVNKEFYNAINYNGNAVKCTACDDLHKAHSEGKLLSNGHIEWDDNFDVRCQSSSFENERCLKCNKLPLCMGQCPRNYLNGLTYCKYDAVDEVFENDLLYYLVQKYK
jgi:uncharacterized protein